MREICRLLSCVFAQMTLILFIEANSINIRQLTITCHYPRFLVFTSIYKSWGVGGLLLLVNMKVCFKLTFFVSVGPFAVTAFLKLKG